MKKLFALTAIIIISLSLNSCSKSSYKKPDAVYQETLSNIQLGSPASMSEPRPQTSEQAAEYVSTKISETAQADANGDGVQDSDDLFQGGSAETEEPQEQQETKVVGPEEPSYGPMPLITNLSEKQEAQQATHKQKARPKPKKIVEEKKLNLPVPGSIIYSLYKQRTSDNFDKSTSDKPASQPITVTEKASSEPTSLATKKVYSVDQGLTVLPPADSLEPGQCLGKLIIFGDYKDVEENVLVREAYTKTIDMPAEYKDEVEELVIIPEKREERIIPAKYEVVKDKVMVKPQRKEWQADEDSGDVMQLVEKPAEYETVTRNVLVQDQTTEVKIRPAVTKKVRRTVLVNPATTKTIQVPAEYKKVIRRIAVTPDREEWHPVLCKKDTKAGIVMKIQRELRKRGYKIANVDGLVGAETKSALDSYQRDLGYFSKGISLVTLESLNINY